MYGVDLLEALTNLDENIHRNNPSVLYEGGIPKDNDVMDYVKLAQKGEVIA